MSLAELRASKRLLVALVYASLLLDNTLLTVVVPILPDYLYAADRGLLRALAPEPARVTAPPPPPPAEPTAATPPAPPQPLTAPGLLLVRPRLTGLADNCSARPGRLQVYGPVPRAEQRDPGPPAGADAAVSETGRVGLLLSSKALVQLACNPAVGMATSRLGCHLPLLLGSASLLAAALAYAYGQHFLALLLARSLQGAASACIGVAGMSLVAELYPEAGPRSRVMGAVLGAAATGVLLGYPLGGLLYHFSGGKAAPFLLLAALLALLTAAQLACLTLKPLGTAGGGGDGGGGGGDEGGGAGWARLLSDGGVLLAAGAIFVSTAAMAVLEPSLPAWLMDTIRPQRWQLGTVFFPDSLGYLLGTNCFGLLAYRLGPWRVAVAALALVGSSAMLIPSASSMAQLVVPHFGLGLGIGVADAALVPLLAALVDCRSAAHYGSVYSLQQTAVSLAYFLGPLAGGELVQALGFPWLMRLVGLLNLLYCPLLLARLLRDGADLAVSANILSSSKKLMDYQSNINCQTNSITYKEFVDSSDSE